MKARKLPETTTRRVALEPPGDGRDTSVRAALRQRRQRRLEEAGMQAAVRALALQMSGSGRGG